MRKLFTTRSLAWLTTLLLAIGPLSGWAQTLTEDFESGTKAAYAAAPVTLSSGTWTFSDAVIGTTAGSDRFNGAKSARLRYSGLISMNFDKPNGAGVITINAGLYGTDTGATFTLEISTDGGTTYTTVPGVPATLTNTLTPYTFTVNQAGAVRLRIGTTNTTTTTAPRVNIDDVTITDAAASTTPAVTATPATLTAFTTAVGTPSATQTITVGGTALTAGVVVTAPAGYNVSLSATTGFAASVTVPQASGTAASTPVYVRLTGAATGTFAGNVTVASTGATTRNVAVTGTVTAVAVPAPTVSSFSPTSGPVGTTVTVTGTNFTGATGATINGVAGTNFMVMSATSVMFDVPTGATSGTIAVTTASGTGTSTASFTVTVPVAVPVITALTPGVQVAGSPAVTLMIVGTGFTTTSTVNFNGVSYPQTTSTATTIEAVVPASALTVAGSYPVSVTNSAGTSNAYTLTVNNPSTAGAFEDFETGTKGGYTAGTVTLASGDWTFSDALIGTAFNDRANGLKSARLRVGFIRMDFDKPNGAGTVIVNAGTFGVDAAASFILEKSIDGGTTFTPVAGAPAVLTNTLTAYTFTVNQGGNVRFRITSTATATNTRINIDDISISNYVGTATLASQALPGLSVFPNPAADRVTVSLPTAAPATVALRDLAGRLVLAPAALGADQQLVLPAALASGVYLLEVRQGDVMAVRRIEKN